MRYLALMITLFFLAAAGADAGGSARLYLYPMADVKPDLCIGDIATIETDADDVDLLAGLSIDSALLSDGYLDSREIDDMVRSTGITCVIYGNAVRIINSSGDTEIQKENFPLIKKGDQVTFVALRGRIKIEVTGTALCDGMKGDDVSVRTRGRCVLSGRVMDRKTVEAGL